MREIKFRGWHTYSQIMSLGVSLQLANFDEDYEIMQFTGLKDKNGKEIYEGDIIKCWKENMKLSDIKKDTDDLPAWEGGFGITIIKNNGWRFYYETIEKPVDGFFYGYDGNEFYVSEYNKNTFEIIGNIYENPELLEVKNG